ncbi:hypothetical protein D3C81_955440 [compost metagenome]
MSCFEQDICSEFNTFRDFGRQVEAGGITVIVKTFDHSILIDVAQTNIKGCLLISALDTEIMGISGFRLENKPQPVRIWIFYRIVAVAIGSNHIGGI